MISLATASDAMQWHPHLHCIVLSCGISPDGTFARCPALNETTLRQLFEAEVSKLLLAKGHITPAVVDNIRSWKHSGFHAYAGPARMRIEEAVQVALYAVRAPAAVGRLSVDPTRPILNYLPKGLRPSSLFEVPPHQARLPRVDRTADLSHTMTDAQIAETLNAEGQRNGFGKPLTRSAVTHIRFKYGLKKRSGAHPAPSANGKE